MTLGVFVHYLPACKSFLFDQEAVAKKNGRDAQYRSGARAARAI